MLWYDMANNSIKLRNSARMTFGVCPKFLAAAMYCYGICAG